MLLCHSSYKIKNMPYPHYLHQGHLHRDLPVCCDFVATHKSVQLVEIILMKQEFYHDIDAETLQVQRMRKLTDLPLSTDDSNRYLVDRYIDKYIGKAVSKLTAYLVAPSPFVHRIANNHADEWLEKSILVALPPTWPVHRLDPLCDAVHQLVVKGAEYELLAVALPNDAYTMLCREQMEDAENEIAVQVNARCKPLTSGYTPLA